MIITDEDIKKRVEEVFIFDPKALSKQGPKDRGRPTKLTPATLERLILSIKAGNTYKAACVAAGISYSVFASWVRTGEKMTEKLENNEAGIRWEFINFLKLLKEAKSMAEVALVAQIAKAGQKDWRANAFILERRNPEDWGRKDRESGEEDRINKVIFEEVEEPKLEPEEPIKSKSKKAKG